MRGPHQPRARLLPRGPPWRSAGHPGASRGRRLRGARQGWGRHPSPLPPGACGSRGATAIRGAFSPTCRLSPDRLPGSADAPCRGLSGTSGGLPSAATPSLHPGGAARLHGTATVGFIAHGFTGAYPHSSLHSFIPRLPTLCLAQDSGLGSGNSFTGKRSRHPNLRVTETKPACHRDKAPGRGKRDSRGNKKPAAGKAAIPRARSPRLLAAQLPSALCPAAKRKPAERRVRSPRAKLSARCSLSLPTMASLMVKGHLMLQKKQRRRVVGAGAGRAHVRC